MIRHNLPLSSNYKAGIKLTPLPYAGESKIFKVKTNHVIVYKLMGALAYFGIPTSSMFFAGYTKDDPFVVLVIEDRLLVVSHKEAKTAQYAWLRWNFAIPHMEVDYLVLSDSIEEGYYTDLHKQLSTFMYKTNNALDLNKFFIKCKQLKINVHLALKHGGYSHHLNFATFQVSQGKKFKWLLPPDFKPLEFSNENPNFMSRRKAKKYYPKIEMERLLSMPLPEVDENHVLISPCQSPGSSINGELKIKSIHVPDEVTPSLDEVLTSQSGVGGLTTLDAPPTDSEPSDVNPVINSGPLSSRFEAESKKAKAPVSTPAIVDVTSDPSCPTLSIQGTQSSKTTLGFGI